MNKLICFVFVMLHLQSTIIAAQQFMPNSFDMNLQISEQQVSDGYRQPGSQHHEPVSKCPPHDEYQPHNNYSKCSSWDKVISWDKFTTCVYKKFSHCGSRKYKYCKKVYTINKRGDKCTTNYKLQKGR